MFAYSVNQSYLLTWPVGELSSSSLDSMNQIISMLKERLFNASDSAAVKIVGLFLLSDILHNSGAPIKHASNYR